jgi:predicted deacylase
VAFTYNIATDRGKVRLLCTDTDAAYPLFEDDEIDYFFTLMGNNHLRAAAVALLTIAAQETLLMKRIKLLDLHTDGPAEAAALRALAADYQEKADLAEAADVGGTFDYAEMVVDIFTARERIDKEALRSG